MSTTIPRKGLEEENLGMDDRPKCLKPGQFLYILAQPKFLQFLCTSLIALHYSRFRSHATDNLFRRQSLQFLLIPQWTWSGGTRGDIADLKVLEEFWPLLARRDKNFDGL